MPDEDLPEWHSAEMRAALDDPAFTVDDDTLVVAQEFRLVPEPPGDHETG